MKKSRGNTQNYRIHIIEKARSRMLEVLREFDAVTLNEMKCTQEEMIDVICGLQYAIDILKELGRELE